MGIHFPNDNQFPGMSDLQNHNFLYAYVTLPNVEANCVGGQCTVNAKKVEGIDQWWQLTPSSNFTTTYLSSEEFNNSIFTHQFDIYDYLYQNVDKFGTNFFGELYSIKYWQQAPGIILYTWQKVFNNSYATSYSYSPSPSKSTSIGLMIGFGVMGAFNGGRLNDYSMQYVY